MNIENKNINIENFLNIDICNDNLKNYITDGKSNLLFKYTFLSLANDFFLNRIKLIDKEHKYNRIIGKTSKIPDNIKTLSHKLYEEYINTYYNNYFNNLNSYKKTIKDRHPDWYRDQPCLPKTPDFLISNIDSLLYSSNFSLDDSIQGYKYSKELLKEITNEDLTPFCTDIKRMLNYEFRDLYNEEVNNYINSLEITIPTEMEFLKNINLKEIEVDKTRLCLNRELSNNREPLNKLLNEFIKNIY